MFLPVWNESFLKVPSAVFSPVDSFASVHIQCLPFVSVILSLVMPSEDDLDCMYDSTWDSLSEEDDSPDDEDQCAATDRPQKCFWNYGRSV